MKVTAAPGRERTSFVTITPLRAFLISFSAGLLALVAGQAILSHLLVTTPETPYQGTIKPPIA
jgi:hypothetical protein